MTDVFTPDFIEANFHDALESLPEDNTSEDDNNTDDHQEDDKEEDNPILAHMTSRKSNLKPGDIRRVMSTTFKREVNNHITYHVNNSASKRNCGALIDRGANGTVGGSDVQLVETIPNKSVNVSGIGNHEISNIPIGTVAGVVSTHLGEVIAIMHQVAYTGKGKSIISAVQLEDFKLDVHDKGICVGGKQCLMTPDGYIHPLDMINGLPYTPMRPPTTEDWSTLKQVIWTSDIEWDPTKFDHILSDNEEWFDTVQGDPDLFIEEQPFDFSGMYKHRYKVQNHDTSYESDDTSDTTTLSDSSIDDVLYDCYLVHHIEQQDYGEILYDNDSFYDVYDINNQELEFMSEPIDLRKKDPDYEKLRPYFMMLPVDIVQKTMEKCTILARMPVSSYLKQRYKSPFPALNVWRRKEALCTDTVYSDTPAIDGGEKSAQIYIGHDSKLADAYGMKTDKEFVNTLEDNILSRGAPSKLISDSAKTETSARVKGVLRQYGIDSWQSEAEHQNQNGAERRYQTIKRYVNVLMDVTGSPAYLWLLCLMYVCFFLNYTACKSLDYATPMSYMTGQVTDVSVLLCFRWYEPIYYKDTDPF